MSTEVAKLRLGFATAVAPLTAVAIYGLVIIADLGHEPRAGETWLGWVVAGVAVTAYLLTLFATAALVVLSRRQKPRSPLTFGIGGLLVSLAVALLFDLPTLNLARVQYYALAGATGICTALVYRAAMLGGARGE